MLAGIFTKKKNNNNNKKKRKRRRKNEKRLGIACEANTKIKRSLRTRPWMHPLLLV